MDRILELAPPWNQASIDGADEQMADILADSLEQMDVSRLTSNPDLMKDIVAREYPVRTRKYQMGKFALKSELARYGKAVYYSADFEATSVMLKAYSGEESSALPWREVEFLRYLKHPNVLALFGAFRCGLSFAILEMCSGNLSQFHEDMSIMDKLRASVQLVNGVEFLHSKSVVHANLSPRVLLFTSMGTLKISEFSGAIALEDGRENYISEQLLGDPAYLDVAALTENQYSRQTDVHSCVCIIYEMHVGKPLLGDGEVEHDRNFFADALTLGYPVTKPEGDVYRQPVKDILDGGPYSNILNSLIEGKMAIQEFLVDPEVAPAITALEKSGNWQVMGEFIERSGWQMKAVGEMNRDAHLDDNFWNFYFDTESDVPAQEMEPEATGGIFCPPLESFRSLEPFAEDPNLTNTWIASLQNGDQFAIDYLKQMCKDTFSIQGKSLEALDAMATNTQLKETMRDEQRVHGIVNKNSETEGLLMTDRSHSEIQQGEATTRPGEKRGDFQQGSAQMLHVSSQTESARLDDKKNESQNVTGSLEAPSSANSAENSSGASLPPRPRTPPFGFRGAAAFTFTHKR